MDKIAVLDFGGQYAHLIANRIRRLGVYSEIFEGETSAENLREFKGLILSGGPASVREANSPTCDPAIFELGIPVLGICYGHQLMAKVLRGKVEKGQVREYGPANVKFASRDGVFVGLDGSEPVWMSHFDQVIQVPEGFQVLGSTGDCPIAAMADHGRKFYGIQFHAEVTHTPHGKIILENFIEICGAKKEWNIDNYIETIIEEIRVTVGDNKVFLMISGGVDSTVAFLLLEKALGQDKVYGLFVDTGFMRMNERNEVEAALKETGVSNLHVFDAAAEYFEALKGVYEPEKKRQIIGDLFLDIQAKVSADLNLNPSEWMLGQGTIYPDTIETGGTKHADKIKTHHNQVDRIKELTSQGRVIEPLRQLYKDEVRMVGERLGLKNEMVWRHPFPGPGLAVRMICAEKEDYPADTTAIERRADEIAGALSLKTKVLPIKSVGVQGDERSYRHPIMVYGKLNNWEDLSKLSTQLTNQLPDINRVVLALNKRGFDQLTIHADHMTPERVLLLQKADKVVMDYLQEVGINRDIWQFPTVLVPIRPANQNGESIVLRPVCSEEAMTANFYQMPFDKLETLTKRLLEIEGIDIVFYDITNKPPGTIEWE